MFPILCFVWLLLPCHPDVAAVYLFVVYEMTREIGGERERILAGANTTVS